MKKKTLLQSSGFVTLCASLVCIVIGLLVGFLVLLLLGGLSSMKDAYPFLPELGATDMFFTAFYPWAIWVVTLVACITGWGRLFEGKNGEPVKTQEEAAKK